MRPLLVLIWLLFVQCCSAGDYDGKRGDDRHSPENIIPADNDQTCRNVKIGSKKMSVFKPGVGESAASNFETAMGYAPQCVLDGVNLPYGSGNHAVVFFKGKSHHVPGGYSPKYHNTYDIDDEYREIKQGQSQSTPTDIKIFIEHYGSDYHYWGPGARNCQDFAQKQSIGLITFT